MFDWFRRKKQPATFMDAFVQTMYGRNAKKTADVSKAIDLANKELLRGSFALNDVTCLATELSNGPVPYSTHDLAASIALGLLKRVPLEARTGLEEVQLLARLPVVTWMKEGKVVPLLAEAFENTLYKEYDPARLMERQPFPEDHLIRAKIAGLVRMGIADKSIFRDLAKPNCAIVLDSSGNVSFRWISESDEIDDVIGLVPLRQLSSYRELLETCALEIKGGTFDDSFLYGPGAILFDRVAIQALNEMKRFSEDTDKQK